MVVQSNIYVPQHYNSCKFYPIIDRSISSPGHGKEVVDGLNAIANRCMSQLMPNVQLTGSKTFDSQIIMHS